MYPDPRVGMGELKGRGEGRGSINVYLTWGAPSRAYLTPSLIVTEVLLTLQSKLFEKSSRISSVPLQSNE